MKQRELAQQLSVLLEVNADRVKVSPVHGGDISRAFIFDFSARCCFVKTNAIALLPMFVAEQQGLEALANSGAIRVPRPLAVGTSGDSAFIALEFIELKQSVDDVLLGWQLAEMHRCTDTQFGFGGDNFIGKSAQPNPRENDWVKFWQEARLGYQLSLAKQNRISSRVIDRGYLLNQKLGSWFSSYQPKASLLHGDLWRGNWAADSTGSPVVYDPACYYGDHETDLALMELFANPGSRFFASYNEHFAIDQDYPVRRDLYNLYHVLNHANMFGAGYVAEAAAMIERLLQQV